MIESHKLSAYWLGITTGLVITLPTCKVEALTRAEVNAVAWQVSVLISPNLTARGDELIIEGEKTGSGVIVGRSGNTYYVLTALHVVSKKGGVHAIATPDGNVHYVDASENSRDVISLGTLSGELGQQIEGMDLALLRFQSDRNYQVARIANTRVGSGESVFVSGWPNPEDLRQKTRDRILTEGAIAQLVNPPSKDGGYSLLYNNNTSSGMSGGPIFNSNGELIGIHGRGRGVENNCSTPEMNANHSCGMQIFDFLAQAAVQNLRLSFNRNPVDYATIQYGVTNRSQTDRTGGIKPAIDPAPPAIAPPPNRPAIVPPAAPAIAPPPVPTDILATAQTIYYINPVTGKNTATAGTSPETPFRSISYAIQGAHPGTAIVLAPGEYSARETFPLKLNSGTILIGNETQQGEGVVIRGGGFESTRSAARQNYTLLAGPNTQILGVTISNPNQNGTGIWVEDSTTTLIRNNTFLNNNREGIFVGGMATPIIENNQFVNNTGNGISLTQQATGQIRGNDFHQTGIGLAIAGTTAPVVETNHIRANKTGVVVTESATPIFRGNIIENNRDYGIITMDAAWPELAETNIFRDNLLSNQLTARTQDWGLEMPSNQVKTTVFGCLEYDGGLATFAQTGKGSIPQPIMNWNNTEFESALNRCRLVTPSLNRIVTLNGGQLEGMAIATGRVNNNNAVCLIDNLQGICRDENLLFYLSGEEQRNPADVLSSFLVFNVAGQGNPVQEVATGAIAPLKSFAERLQPEPGLWFAD